jgi:hypothetical protein
MPDLKALDLPVFSLEKTIAQYAQVSARSWAVRTHAWP